MNKQEQEHRRRAAKRKASQEARLSGRRDATKTQAKAVAAKASHSTNKLGQVVLPPDFGKFKRDDKK